MRRPLPWILAGLVLVVGLLVLGWSIWRSPGRSRRAASGHDTSTIEPATQEGSDVVASAPLADIEAGGRAVVGGLPEPGADEGAAPKAGELDTLLARLRELAPAADYHSRAWPIVTAMASIVRGKSAGPAPEPSKTTSEPADPTHERVRSLALGAESDCGRVRGACLIALTLGSEPDEAGPTVEALLEAADLEVSRAAWLALALDAHEPATTAIDASRLHGPLSMRTYPVAIHGIVAPKWRVAASARALREMSAEWEDAHVLQDAGQREELFTRWIAALACIAPAAGQPSPERTLLFEWLRARKLPGLFLREIAAYCLAQAAVDDAQLLRELEETVFESLREDGPELANLLVEATGRADLALSFAREILGGQQVVTDDLSRAYGFNLLRAALQAEDAATREAAQNFAVERLFANDLEEFDQRLLLTQIEAGGSALLLDIGARVFERDLASSRALATAAALGRVRDGPDVEAARHQLESTFFRAEASTNLKIAVLKALVKQDPLVGREFASVQGLADRDASVRAQAQALLEHSP